MTPTTFRRKLRELEKVAAQLEIKGAFTMDPDYDVWVASLVAKRFRLRRELVTAFKGPRG